jgi:hypothetical protein
MLYGNTVQDTRHLFFESWRKHLQNLPFTPLEAQLINVIQQHPEYHTLLAQQDKDAHYTPEQGESNPFLHMGLHLAIRDQVAMNRPIGIQTVYQQLLQRYHDPHRVEHLLLEPLADCIWLAQKQQRAPDEQAYLRACQNLVTAG